MKPLSESRSCATSLALMSGDRIQPEGRAVKTARAKTAALPRCTSSERRARVHRIAALDESRQPGLEPDPGVVAVFLGGTRNGVGVPLLRASRRSGSRGRPYRQSPSRPVMCLAGFGRPPSSRRALGDSRTPQRPRLSRWAHEYLPLRSSPGRDCVALLSPRPTRASQAGRRNARRSAARTRSYVPSSPMPSLDTTGARRRRAPRGARRVGRLRVRSVVVPSPSDGTPHSPEQHQDQPDHQDDDAERPQDRDFEQEPGDEQGEANDDQEVLLTEQPGADAGSYSQKVER
jgi:hypothetical protein